MGVINEAFARNNTVGDTRAAWTEALLKRRNEDEAAFNMLSFNQWSTLVSEKCENAPQSCLLFHAMGIVKLSSPSTICFIRTSTIDALSLHVSLECLVLPSHQDSTRHVADSARHFRF